MEIITCETLHNLFYVDMERGKLIWKKPPRNHPRLLGMEAGSPRAGHSKTYWVIKIGRVAYRRGRLVFLAAHGHFPEPCVDHINGNSLDDRIENLREATVAENARNHKTRARRINLPMGVRVLRSSGRFQARISLDGKQFHLGAYDTPEQASAVYLAKRKELFREFA